MMDNKWWEEQYEHCKARYPELCELTKHWGPCYYEYTEPEQLIIHWKNSDLYICSEGFGEKRIWELCLGFPILYNADSYKDICEFLRKPPLINEVTWREDE